MSSREAALSKMSKYLLSGAEMLSESCPDCQIPLLRNKENSKIFCANCQRKVMYTSDTDIEKVKHKISNLENSKIVLNNLETVILGKLEQLSNSVVNTKSTDLELVLNQINTILIIIEKLNELNR